MTVIECPNCKQEAWHDFYYKTGEDNIHCNHCGYYYHNIYRRDDKGDLITLDGSDNYSFNNLIMDEEEVKNPYAAYRIEINTGEKSPGFKVGTIENEEHLEFMKDLVMKTENYSSLIISRFIDGKIKQETIIDKQDGLQEL